MSLFTENELKKLLAGMKGWNIVDNEIRKKFEFPNFVHAMGFVNSIASIAESLNHHPDINIRWNVVELTLTTHSENGITEKDISLAKKIDALMR